MNTDTLLEKYAESLKKDSKLKNNLSESLIELEYQLDAENRTVLNLPSLTKKEFKTFYTPTIDKEYIDKLITKDDSDLFPLQKALYTLFK